MSHVQTYSIDTSALIQASSRAYPIDVFPSWWTEFDQLINKGIVICIEEIYEEVKKKDDILFNWVKQRKSQFFHPLETQIQIAATKILAKFPTLIDSSKNRSGADPFVISLALVKNLTVVTEEKNEGNQKRPRIPYVCNYYQVNCISLVEMMREIAWSF